MNTTYTIYDIKNAGYNLEPLICLACGDKDNVIYNNGIGDAVCECCGAWQLDIKKGLKQHEYK